MPRLRPSNFSPPPHEHCPCARPHLARTYSRNPYPLAAAARPTPCSPGPWPWPRPGRRWQRQPPRLPPLRRRRLEILHRQSTGRVSSSNPSAFPEISRETYSHLGRRHPCREAAQPATSLLLRRPGRDPPSSAPQRPRSPGWESPQEDVPPPSISSGSYRRAFFAFFLPSRAPCDTFCSPRPRPPRGLRGCPVGWYAVVSTQTRRWQGGR
mmetsp:Transcript_15532/g.37241  ORF Transcript_15532/g.37241 Transcript_15532/m.37241 type:complete len:210 (+) Transcript_15532:4560-5189(+)